MTEAPLAGSAAPADRDVERIAWSVLLSSFLAFLVLLFGIPALGWWYLNTATGSHETAMTVLAGTAIVELPGREPSGERANRMVPEGAIIRTDANTRADLRLFDGSTIIVFQDSHLTLATARSPIFDVSPQSLQTHLVLRGGRLRVTAAESSRALDLRIRSPHGQALLQPGTYLIEVTEEQTELIVRSGQALVQARDSLVRLGAGERSVVKAGEPPRGPLPARRDLIANGSFAAPIADSWKIYNDQGGDGGQVDGIAQVEFDQGQRVVRFIRFGSGGNHNETGIEQAINRDISDAESLRLRAELRLNYQSLSGGGYLSSEFPLMIRIRYVDVKGGQNFWVRGFYYENEARNPTVHGEQVPQGLWYPFESPDLTRALDPKPAIILSVQIYASGWDYDSMVSDIGLIVE